MENLRSLAIFIALPFVCTGRFLLSFVAHQERQKTWRRVIIDAIIRWILQMHSLHRLAYLLGSSEDTYTKWAKRNKMERRIDDIGENAKLFWILNEGTEVPDRVVLYLHGGGFHLPMAEHSASFWYHVQKELKNLYGLDVGVAILDYSLIPEANFPVPLRQTVKAIEHLFSRGIKGSDIILMGDSAGGNLALQLVLHIIHPMDGVPKLSMDSKFAGVYLMSPWLTLLPRETESQRCYEENARWDVVSASTLVESGSIILAGIKDEAHRAYMDSYYAPAGWYDDMGGVVKRVLITAGRYECLREDIVKFGKHLETLRDLEVNVVVDEYGVHDDPFNDFIAGEKRLGEVTGIIISWFHDGYVVI